MGVAVCPFFYMPIELYQPDELVVRLTKEKEVARKFQNRRHDDWNENYELYRNKVKLNRLTQRQAVNIPLMKETIKTLLSKIDDAPSVDWKEQSGDLEKQLIMQEKWNNDYDALNFEGVDMQDKKTVLLYGRGFKKLNWLKNNFAVNNLDIFDGVIDPLTDPLDIETARFFIHQNIFKTARQILADPRYSNAAKKELKQYLLTADAIIQSSDNEQELKEKQERMEAMGVDQSEFNKWAAGDTVLNLCEHYSQVWDKKKKKFEWRVYVYADDKVLLLEDSLQNLMGIEFLPFVTWGEDIETQDIWSDGPADLVRVPNKVLNVWFSQMIENRTLKNFQMHWYDATQQGYSPQTYEPGPGRMLPAPGNPKDVIMPVEISGLDETINQIGFLIKLVESGTAATATEKGEVQPERTTLGEVELAVGKAMERTMSLAKFYRRSWFEFATKWYRIREANEGRNSKSTLYKVSSSGKLWPKDVYGRDWKSKAGYKAIVRSSSELENEKIKGLQQFMFLKGQFPDNLALAKIAQKRMLELVDFTPDEIREVEDFEKKKIEMMGQPQQQQQQPMQPQNNEEMAMAQQLQAKANEVAQLTI